MNERRFTIQCLLRPTKDSTATVALRDFNLADVAFGSIASHHNVCDVRYGTNCCRDAAVPRSVEKCDVWRAPAMQEESDVSARRSGAAMYGRRPRCKRNLTFPRGVRVQPCIRPWLPHVIRLTTITLRHFNAGERAPSTTP